MCNPSKTDRKKLPILLCLSACLHLQGGSEGEEEEEREQSHPGSEEKGESSEGDSGLKKGNKNCSKSFNSLHFMFFFYHDVLAHQ